MSRPVSVRRLSILNAFFAALIAGLSMSPAVAGGRLPATGGVTQFEGAAGGGLTPWALIAGYGTRDEIGASVFATFIDTDDFSLHGEGVAIGWRDRLELSYARQHIDLGRRVPGQAIDLHTAGFKLKLLGNAVFDQDRWWPQLALGLQYKWNEDFALVPAAVGARDDSGLDIYLSATKLLLGAAAGYNLLLTGTLRATRANQLGLLGFGGDLHTDYQATGEGSVAVMLNDRWLVGMEGRSRPDNLRASPEDAAFSVFTAWFPLKSLGLTAAWVDLGRVGGTRSQQGGYLSLQLSY